MKLILPFPPSVNTYWRHPNKGAFAGKSLISAAGRKFQSAACAAIVEQLRRLPKPTSAPASVEIVLFPPDTRSQTATSRLELIEPLMGEIYGNPQATQKMLDDAFFNVEAWINSELATEFAEQEEIAFTSGDGTKKPKGFLAYESTDETDKVRAFGKLQHIVSGEATAVTADAIIKLIYTLRKAHRTGAKFMMNNNSLFAIRLLKDTEGNYLWRPGLELGQPSSLAGYGIAENEQMPDIAADAKAIAFGNFKRGYTIVDRIGTRILRDPYTNKPFVGFYTTKRTGGMLVDSQAIKLLKIAAA